MKKIAYLISVSFVLCFSASAYECHAAAPSASHEFLVPPIPNQPREFWGMTWGDSPDKLGEDTVLAGRRGLLGEAYDMRKKGASFEGFPVDKVRFVFNSKKLVTVGVYFEENVDADELLRSLDNTYGESTLTSKKVVTETFSWMDEDVKINLEISPAFWPRLTVYNMKLFEKLSSESNN